MDMQSRRDGCGLYAFARMLDVPYVETVSRAGYRFIAEVRDLTPAKATTRGVRRCLPVSSPGEFRTSGGIA